MSSSPSIPFLRESATGDASQAVACGIKLDLSRQRLTQGDLEGLFKFAAEKDLLGAHARMIRGECVNGSEGRPALHTSLRAFSLSAPRYAGCLRNVADFLILHSECVTAVGWAAAATVLWM